MKKGNKSKAKHSDDELDLSHLNETVEETERRRDAEANLTQLHGRNAASADFDAPFAAGLGSAGVIPNNEDGDFSGSGSMLRIDLGDGSIDGMSDLNDVSGNPEVYNGPRNAEQLADLSEGGMGGMSIEHVNDIDHGTRGLPDEVKQHEAKRKAQRVRFKKTEGNPLMEPAPRATSSSNKNSGNANSSRSATKSTPKPKAKSASNTRSVKSKPSAKPASRKGSVKKSVAKKSAKKSPTKKSSSKKSSAKRSSSKKSDAKKSSSKKSSSKKSGVKKSAVKKSSSKKVSSTKSNRVTKRTPMKKSKSKSRSSRSR